MIDDNKLENKMMALALTMVVESIDTALDCVSDEIGKEKGELFLSMVPAMTGDLIDRYFTPEGRGEVAKHLHDILLGMIEAGLLDMDDEGAVQ